jgi:hypothetical protein
MIPSEGGLVAVVHLLLFHALVAVPLEVVWLWLWVAG